MRQNVRRTLSNCRIYGNPAELSPQLADLPTFSTILFKNIRRFPVFTAMWQNVRRTLPNCHIYNNPAELWPHLTDLLTISTILFKNFRRFAVLPFLRPCGRTFAVPCRIAVFTAMRQNFRRTLPIFQHFPQYSLKISAVLPFCRFYGYAAERSPYPAKLPYLRQWGRTICRAVATSWYDGQQ